jgi:hypothetical protein
MNGMPSQAYHTADKSLSSQAITTISSSPPHRRKEWMDGKPSQAFNTAAEEFIFSNDHHNVFIASWPQKGKDDWETLTGV